jgi:hypothetical protein
MMRGELGIGGDRHRVVGVRRTCMELTQRG